MPSQPNELNNVSTVLLVLVLGNPLSKNERRMLKFRNHHQPSFLRAGSRARGATLRAEGGCGWRATPSSCGTQPPEGQLTAPGLGPWWQVSGSTLPLARASAEESVLVFSLLLPRQALWDQAVSL